MRSFKLYFFTTLFIGSAGAIVQASDCPCCPTNIDTLRVTSASTSQAQPRGTAASLCCVQCDKASASVTDFLSAEYDAIPLVSENTVLLQTSVTIPSEGIVIVMALCYVDRQLNNSDTSTIVFEINSEGGIPFHSKGVKILEPVQNPADSRIQVIMERQFQVSEGNANISLSAHRFSEKSIDVAQQRMLFVTFVPSSNRNDSVRESSE